MPEIQRVATAVFKEQGYDLKGVKPELMVFERLGSRAETMKWGGWLDSSGVVMRIKVGLREMSEGTYLLQADAYAVRNPGDPFFEDESRNMILNRHPYQKMLNEVRKRLDSLPPEEPKAP